MEEFKKYTLSDDRLFYARECYFTSTHITIEVMLDGEKEYMKEKLSMYINLDMWVENNFETI